MKNSRLFIHQVNGSSPKYLGITLRCSDTELFHNVIALIKTIPGRQYLVYEKVWVVSLEYYAEVLGMFNSFGFTVEDKTIIETLLVKQHIFMPSSPPIKYRDFNCVWLQRIYY